MQLAAKLFFTTAYANTLAEIASITKDQKTFDQAIVIYEQLNKADSVEASKIHIQLSDISWGEWMYSGDRETKKFCISHTLRTIYIMEKLAIELQPDYPRMLERVLRKGIVYLENITDDLNTELKWKNIYLKAYTSYEKLGMTNELFKG